MKLFDAFKHYIVKHPKVAAYKSSSPEYDEEKLLDILKVLEPMDLDSSDVERDKVIDFLYISTYLHKLYVEFYSDVQKRLADFNMRGEEIVEFFIAFMNKEFKTVNEKMKEASVLIPQGTYLSQEMANHKVELPDGTKIDLKAAMEAEVDAISMLCNYLRYHLDEEYRNEDADPKGKFRKDDLLAYVVKLTGIKPKAVVTILEALEADWKKYNYIWTAPLFKIKDYYCLAFYPIVNAMPYNIIEHLMSRGGYDIDQRGYDFEQYVYRQITSVRHQYQLACIAARQFGPKDTGEQIDLLVATRDAVVLAEAKCIHYSMEPQNYGDAWSRIEFGAEQALRKVGYMKAHPEQFAEFGDVGKKKIIPVVLTNYPVYSGFEHKGVYVIDSHTFICYFNSGYITKREMAMDENPIVDVRLFYRNETEFSANFENYLKDDPVKSIHMPKMVIEDIPLLSRIEPWKCIAKTAVYKGYPGFDISNRPRTLN